MKKLNKLYKIYQEIKNIPLKKILIMLLILITSLKCVSLHLENDKTYQLLSWVKLELVKQRY